MLQMLVLSAQLTNYGLGWWCLSTQQARELASMPMHAATGSYLDQDEEAWIALLAVLCAVGPLIPTIISMYKTSGGIQGIRSRLARRKEETDASDMVKMVNPMQGADDDDEDDGGDDGEDEDEGGEGGNMDEDDADEDWLALAQQEAEIAELEAEMAAEDAAERSSG